MFVFDADVIIHEAGNDGFSFDHPTVPLCCFTGIPPIHTPLSVLNDLPKATKKKMLVVHTHAIPDVIEKIDAKTSQTKKVPISDLVIPKCGVKNTIRIDVGQFQAGYVKALKYAPLVISLTY